MTDCDHDHTDPADPVLCVSARMRPMPEGKAMLHVVLEYCPQLGDAELAAVAGALSRSLGELQASALASLAQAN